MRVLVQRSLDSKVEVDNKTIGSITNGLVLLVGFTEGDNIDTIKYLVRKVVNLRIFDDEDGVMNKSILDVGGSVLSISQFTLYADTSKGNRPSYIKAMKHEKAKEFYKMFNEKLREYISVEEGIFGENMNITFTNNGPVTIILER